MSTITERFHDKRLKKFNINIKTKFQDGENVSERNSNNSYNDDIKNGIILNKTYFKNNQPIHIENKFNPSLLYSFVINNELESDIKCPNCGMIGKGKDFENGCPYCGSIYTIEYSDKNVGAKLHLNYIMKNSKYKFRVLFTDFVICFILSFLYCVTTGRTFTIFDIAKILGLASMGTLLLFYPFYMLDSYLVSNKVIKENEKKHQKQLKFWEDISKYNISKKIFFNNLNSELNEYFYDGSYNENKNVIDYDVIDYNDYEYNFDSQKRINIKVEIDVRVIELVNEAIKTSNKTLCLTLVQNEILEDEYHPGIYIAKCHGCGASIDILKNKCDYCGAKIHYLQSWYISEIKCIR